MFSIVTGVPLGLLVRRCASPLKFSEVRRCRFLSFVDGNRIAEVRAHLGHFLVKLILRQAVLELQIPLSGLNKLKFGLFLGRLILFLHETRRAGKQHDASRDRFLPHQPPFVLRYGA